MGKRKRDAGESVWQSTVLENLSIKSQRSVEEQDMAKSFEQMANFLMKNCEIKTLGIETRRYRLLEVEFYLYSEATHDDPYCHSRAEQCQTGKWYFHRAGKSPDSGFRGGTRKGLDITIGQDGHYGGILLRSMIRIGENDANTDIQDVITGPCRLVERILSDTQATSIHQLVYDIWDGDTSVFGENSLALVQAPYPTDSQNTTIATIRIGLSLSAESVADYMLSFLNNKAQNKCDGMKRCIYFMKPYRFVDQKWIESMYLAKCNIKTSRHRKGRTQPITPQTALSLDFRAGPASWRDTLTEGSKLAQEIYSSDITDHGNIVSLIKISKKLDAQSFLKAVSYLSWNELKRM